MISPKQVAFRLLTFYHEEKKTLVKNKSFSESENSKMKQGFLLSAILVITVFVNNCEFYFWHLHSRINLDWIQTVINKGDENKNKMEYILVLWKERRR